MSGQSKSQVNTERKWAKLFSFTGLLGAFRSLRSVLWTLKPLRPSNIYTLCSDLPLYNFIKCVVNDDLTYLIVDRTKEAQGNFREVWGKIFEEYLSLIKNNEVTYLRDLQNDIQKLSAKMFLVNASLFSLYNNKDEAIIEVLNDTGFSVQDSDDMEKFYESLQKIASQAKGLQVQFEMKSKELEGLRRNHIKTKIDEAYFAKMLLQLSKQQGYKINSKEITVLEFIELQDIVVKELEWQARK